MKIHLNEVFNTYEVTECDRKFGNEITLDGETLIPLDKVKQAKLEVEDIRELTKDGWKSPRELKEEFIEILDKLIAESEG